MTHDEAEKKLPEGWTLTYYHKIKMWGAHNANTRAYVDPATTPTIAVYRALRHEALRKKAESGELSLGAWLWCADDAAAGPYRGA